MNGLKTPHFVGPWNCLDAGDVAGLRAHLKHEGGNYFRNPTLLEFAAENPVRHGTLPQNIAAVAAAILDAGVEQATLNETLMLVATGSVPREGHVQLPLIELLCDRRADPDSAVEVTALHGEMEALNALIARGARFNLPVAAAPGLIEDFRRLFPAADGRERHLALALASQFGVSKSCAC